VSLFTKLHLKYLWLSKTYSFRWAHKPLCDHYKKDILSFGTVHLCRSCVASYSGIVAGLLFTLFSTSSSKTISLLLMLLLIITLPLSHPAIYKNIFRLFRDILRFNLGIIVSFSLLLLFYHQEIVLPVIVLFISAIFWKHYYKKRKVRKIQFCEECTEYQTDSICSGYKIQADMIRDYEDKATELLYENAYIPKILRGKQQKLN
jgi:hypothetical protein